MTYASRKSWISLGLGSSSSLTSPASASSSSMISLQRSMHSSQMYTPGPAMSFFTCFWLFPQKEHFSRSPPSPNLATRSPPRPDPPDSAHPGGRGHRGELPVRQHLVDDAVLPALVGTHDEVPVGVLPDALERLAGVMGQDLLQEVPHPDDLLRLDLDVDRLAGGSTVRLVDQDPGVREGETLAVRARTQEHGSGRSGLPDA